MRKALINPDTKVFPANYLLILINFLQFKGFDISDIAAKITIPKHVAEDPEQFVTYGFLKEFLESVLTLTKMPELGLNFGQQLNFTAHGDMGNAIITSKNLGEALQLILKYFKTRTALAEFNFVTNDKSCVITGGFSLLPDEMEYFLVDALFVSMFTTRKFILSHSDQDLKIYLKRPKPKNVKPYHDIFGKHVYFSAEKNEYHIAKESLDLTFPLSNPIAREIAERKCQQKMKELIHLDDLVSKVKTLLLATPSYFPNIDELSQSLHMSTRTLRRKLNDLDSSYQTILDDLRKELAINYLQNSQLSILEIAHMLQFSDSSNFSSAFRKWTNKAPSDYRAV